MPVPGISEDTWIDEAARRFLEAPATQSAEHIKPFHRYFALRLVLEGGFFPDDLRPKPPLTVRKKEGEWHLSFGNDSNDGPEQVVLGGMKSKRIDVVVRKEGVGPVLAVSVKGTRNAFRNLVNRAEEAIGDCANIHLMYPGLVYGFVHLLQVTVMGTPGMNPNDISLDKDGAPVPAIRAYASGLEGLVGRRYLRNDYARYEAVGLALIRPTRLASEGPLFPGFPTRESPLHLDAFFSALYNTYDLRFPNTYTDPTLRYLGRAEWHPESPALTAIRRAKAWNSRLGYRVRMA